ncbi:MAG: RNA-directed DNA polymerase, partial [Desulfobacterales bacterium]|nr:RNA-directed DNA polymerase [Desulfobacterales bacterium]
FEGSAAAEIQDLIDRGLARKVENSEWVAPVVYVKKPDGGIRVTVDYSGGLNPQIIPASHPLPRPEEVFQGAKGAQYFSKLDVTKGYFHIPLHPDSTHFMAFITSSHGLCEFLRLPMGMVDSGAVYQRAVEHTLRGAKGVEAYIDDVLVYGRTKEEHDRHLFEVCRRLQDAGFRLNMRKVVIAKSQLTMLGSVLTATPDGVQISVDPAKAEAIQKLQIPKNVSGVRSFLGTCNQFSKYISSYSEIAEPLNALLQKNQVFIWSDECNDAFEISKAKVSSAQVLTPF